MGDTLFKFNRNNSGNTNKKKLFALGIALLILVTLPISLLALRNSTENRQRATVITPTPGLQTTCGNAPADIMLIIDRSGSMNSPLGSSSTKIGAAIAAAQKFVDLVAQDTRNRVGIVTFATTASLDTPLTNNYASVKTKIGQIKANGTTCTECGVVTNNQEISAHGRSNIKKVTILLTDGLANTILGNTNQVATPTAETKAIDAVKAGYTTNQTAFFTIGLGNKNGNAQTGINEKFLQQIATMTSAQYYYSPSTTDLDHIYQDISQIFGKGSVSGTVFNDANRNKQFDSGESPLVNWTINLKGGTNNQIVATANSDSSGAYKFTGICDGTYTVDETIQTGWELTIPTNPNNYSVSIANGSNNPNKNFGNATSLPTPTPTACPTPGNVSNLQITCPNCPSPTP